MRFIESPWRARTRLAVVAMLALALLPSARGSRWPQYGGTMRVEMRVTSVSLDPREWKMGTAESAADEKLGALVYDRLVSLDNYGRFQPQLATEWSHDTSFKRWQFTLRAGVKFSDGTALSNADAAAALQPLLPDGQQISVSGNNLVFQSEASMPDLLEELASGRFFVYRVQPDGTLMGTGPFFVSETAGGGRGPSSSSTAAVDSNLAASSPGVNPGRGGHSSMRLK
jgi:MarR-like DNA-binding transcriptional regulator SgrR of sgrS sRNA